MVIMKKWKIMVSMQRNWNPHTLAGVNIKCGTVWLFLKELYIELPQDPKISV